MRMKNALIYIVKYIAAWICGITFIIGLSAIIFEENLMVRFVGGISALVAVIIGNIIWKKKKADNGDNNKSSSLTP